MSHSPFKGPEVLVVNLQIFFSKLCDGILLAQPATSVLERGEDGGADVNVVSQDVGDVTQPPGQQFASLDCHWSQLRFAIQHVTDGKYIANVGLLRGVVKNFSILGIQSNANFVQTHVSRTVIFAIGRDACTANMGLDKIGVALNPKNGKVLHDAAEKTNVGNIFAIGDVLDGKPELTPVAIQAG